jgi:hypothetical protein
MSLLFTTPTGEIVELTQEEVSSGIAPSSAPAHDKDETSSKALVMKLDYPIQTRYSSLSLLDGSADSAVSPAPLISPMSAHSSSSCGSSSALIEIVTPGELRKYTKKTPQPSTITKQLDTRKGSKSRSLVKVAMAYDEYGELVEERKLRHHPTPDELSITQLLRMIKKKVHHEVSTQLRQTFLKSKASNLPLTSCTSNIYANGDAV